MKLTKSCLVYQFMVSYSHTLGPQSRDKGTGHLMMCTEMHVLGLAVTYCANLVTDNRQCHITGAQVWGAALS